MATECGTAHAVVEPIHGKLRHERISLRMGGGEKEGGTAGVGLASCRIDHGASVLKIDLASTTMWGTSV